MVIEKFKDGCFDTVYQGFTAQGHLLPDGLNYLNSRLSSDHRICFQFMETNDPAVSDVWCARRDVLVDFQIYPLDEPPAH